VKKPVGFVLLIIALILGINQLFPQILSFTDFRMIQSMRNEWHELYLQRPVFYLTSFFFLHAFLAMLPVPALSMFSFLGAALFGFGWGFGLSSVATAVGNLGAFMLARLFLRDWVLEKFGKHVEIFKKDWQTNGALALFSLRLFPVAPSFIANLIMGVSPLNAWTFFWVSWLGRIPMVLFYTLAGEQISKISRVEDILSPPILISFGVLALAPWIFKYLLEKSKTKKRTAKV